MVHYKYFVFNTLKSDDACIDYLIIYIYACVLFTIHIYIFNHLIMNNVIIK